MFVKVEAKLAVHQVVLDDLEVKMKVFTDAIGEQQQSLSKVEGPIKKLMDDKFAMQKKLDQPTLDRCSKYLSKHSDERIIFITQSLVGILRGQ